MTDLQTIYKAFFAPHPIIPIHPPYKALVI